MGNTPQRDIFVAVPSYNHAGYIEECLRSIFHQSVHPNRLLVIDDGSTDGSVRIIERVLKECPFDAELVARGNRGLCSTLNEAFSACSARYFAYLGSDDYWLSDFLKGRFELLESRPRAVLAYGHADLIDDAGRVRDCTLNYTDTWAHYPDGNAREMLLEGVVPISSTVCYRTEALRNVRWDETARLEDYEMYLSLVDRGEFAFDPRVLSVWRDHASNTSKDIHMLMDEVISAQVRHQEHLGLTSEQLKRNADRTRFRCARIMLQHGQKRAAVRVALKNAAGAETLGQQLRFWTRVLIPMSAIGLYREMKIGRSTELETRLTSQSRK